MEQAAIRSVEPKASTPLNRRAPAALVIGALAVLWFMLLSGWTGTGPHSILMSRNNVLFDSDTNLWVSRMITSARSPEQNIHPLELVLWRYPCRALAHIARLFLPADAANIFGPRLLVAIFAGAGVGALAYLALYYGVPLVQCLLLFGSYFLFTDNILVSLPEHFGVSNGLLSITFVVLVMVSNERLRNLALAALAVMCAGTSILNGVFPVLCLADSMVKSTRLKLRLLVAGIPLGLVLSAALYRFSGTIHSFFSYYAHFRLLRHPGEALVYTVYLLAAPAVGAIPYLKEGFPTEHGWLMLTYDPVPPQFLSFCHYYGVLGIGALLWLVLLARCIQLGFRDAETRPYVSVAVLWVLFNLVFYGVWGREPYLFASAWSWTLMALVILGARHLSRAFTVAMVLPIAACQLFAMHQIKTLLETIPR